MGNDWVDRTTEYLIFFFQFSCAALTILKVLWPIPYANQGPLQSTLGISPFQSRVKKPLLFLIKKPVLQNLAWQKLQIHPQNFHAYGKSILKLHEHQPLLLSNILPTQMPAISQALGDGSHPSTVLECSLSHKQRTSPTISPRIHSFISTLIPKAIYLLFSLFYCFSVFN